MARSDASRSLVTPVAKGAYRKAKVLGFLVVAEARCASGARAMLTDRLVPPTILASPGPLYPALLEPALQLVPQYGTQICLRVGQVGYGQA